MLNVISISPWRPLLMGGLAGYTRLAVGSTPPLLFSAITRVACEPRKTPFDARAAPKCWQAGVASANVPFDPHRKLGSSSSLSKYTVYGMRANRRRYSDRHGNWRMPWLPRVLPIVVELTTALPERTMFTRFLPAERPGEGVGMWRR